MNSIFDAMPIADLQELERLEIAIKNMEGWSFHLQANAQDLRLRREEIITSWKIRAEKEGLENLIAERQRQDALAWIYDPLPSAQVAEAREGYR
ncbi:MAG: hypothetical protein ABFC24_11505 [Methanoregulaceae archaeon]